jgi:hypothetical protein
VALHSGGLEYEEWPPHPAAVLDEHGRPPPDGDEVRASARQRSALPESSARLTLSAAASAEAARPCGKRDV